jgi:hypothetical protein
MLTEIEIIKSTLDSALTYEDIFGNFTGSEEDMLRHVKTNYKMLAKAVYPDTHPTEKALADEVFSLIGTWYTRALELIKEGKWGQKVAIHGREQITIVGKTENGYAEYVRQRTLCAGDMADIHWGYEKGFMTPILIKACRHSADNDFLKAERTNTDIVRKKMETHDGKIWQQCIPKVFDSFLLTEGSLKRRINIQDAFLGYLNLNEVHNLMPQGLDGRTIVWMWKRMVVLLDWTYRSGIIHGAVLPCHIMFYPDNDGSTTRDIRKHSIRLVDWCYSIEHKTRTRLSAWVPAYQRLYAPEIVAKKPLDHSTDLYMGAMTMLEMCDKTVPKEITDSIRRWVEKNPKQRPAQTMQYFQEFLGIQKAIYGAPQWHDFNVPGGPAK